MRVTVWTRVATGLVLLGAAALVGGGPAAEPAWAHSRLLRTEPADGSAVNTPITRVTLTFNETVRADFTTVVVNGPDDTGYGKGHVQVVDHEVRQETYPLGSGGYRVAWRAVSSDGHPIEGQFAFTLTLPPGQEPAPPPAPDQDAGAAAGSTTNSGGGWLWGAATVVVLGLAVGAFALRRRRRHQPAGTR